LERTSVFACLYSIHAPCSCSRKKFTREQAHFLYFRTQSSQHGSKRDRDAGGSVDACVCVCVSECAVPVRSSIGHLWKELCVPFMACRAPDFEAPGTLPHSPFQLSPSHILTLCQGMLTCFLASSHRDLHAELPNHHT